MNICIPVSAFWTLGWVILGVVIGAFALLMWMGHEWNKHNPWGY